MIFLAIENDIDCMTLALFHRVLLFEVEFPIRSWKVPTATEFMEEPALFLQKVAVELEAEIKGSKTRF